MNFIKKIFHLLSFLVCILHFPLNAQENSNNLLINGSFEEGYEAGSYKNLKSGENFPGWKVTQETIDINGSYFMAPDGKQSIDLNGYNSGAIEQRFFTDPGKKYLVSFYLAGNTAGNPIIKEMKVSAADQSELFQFDVTGKTTSDPGWEYSEFVFKAEQRATTLRFESNQGPESTSYGPMIDDVKVTRYKKSKSKLKKNSKKKPKDKTKANKKEPKTKREFLSFHYGLLGGSSLYFLNKEKALSLINYNNSIYDLEATKADWGIHAGLFAQVGIGPVLIRPELRFNSNRIQYSLSGGGTPTQEAIERYQMLDIPILLGYQYRNFKFILGPSGHLFLGRQSTLKDLGDFTSSIKRFTYGYELGIGYQYNKIMLDFRFVGNMSRFGDGLLINTKKHYFTDIPPSLMITLSYEIN